VVRFVKGEQNRPPGPLALLSVVPPKSMSLSVMDFFVASRSGTQDMIATDLKHEELWYWG